MHKLILRLTIVVAFLGCFLTTSILAQSLFSGTTPSSTIMPTTPAKSLKTPPTPPSDSVMQPADFNNAINSAAQQSKSNLKQQMNQDLSKTPPPSQNSNTSNSSNTSISNETDNGTTTSAPSSSTTNQGTSIYMPSSTVSKPTGNAPGTSQKNNSGTSGSSIYSGFGAGNSNTKGSTTNSPNSNSSGGWNIKY